MNATAFAFEFSAELEIDEASRSELTKDFFRELLLELGLLNGSVLILTGEITSIKDGHKICQRIEMGGAGCTAESTDIISRRARGGYGLVMVFHDFVDIADALKKYGYKPSMTEDEGASHMIEGWIHWLSNNIRDSKIALVFGHDYEPAFIFRSVPQR